MKSQLRSLAQTIAAAVLRPVYGGLGCIVCLHRVLPDAERSFLPENRALELTDAGLRELLAWVRKRGLDAICLNEVSGRLERPGKRRFVVFTFDDGYRDNLTHALPIFREFGVPFAVNITTGFISRSEPVWWYVIERVLAARQSAEFQACGEKWNFAWSVDVQGRDTMLQILARKIRAFGPAARNEFVQAMCAVADVDAKQVGEELILSWNEAKKLADDPLVTIGAHTVTHCQLSALTQEEVRRELAESRRVLETELGRSVNHLAYPFGGKSAAGPREYEIAKECGYGTAVTTCCANLFREHERHLCSLPRIGVGGGYPPVSRFRNMESGLIPAVENRLKRFP